MGLPHEYKSTYRQIGWYVETEACIAEFAAPVQPSPNPLVPQTAPFYAADATPVPSPLLVQSDSHRAAVLTCRVGAPRV